MCDEKTASLLIEWGFESYVDVFKENKVDTCALLLLDDAQVRALIPTIGLQAKFKKVLSDWKVSQEKVQGGSVMKQIHRKYLNTEPPSVLERNARINKWLCQISTQYTNPAVRPKH